jgi:hypothetical protein
LAKKKAQPLGCAFCIRITYRYSLANENKSK